ncbi:MAG: polysaccharide deacetylase family protein [Chloroflexi bacterium]|nr:polysaccharide deacetylase family protein [Chloroflexota bacterium]
MNARTALAAALLLTGTVLAGCEGGDEPAPITVATEARSPTSAPSPTATAAASPSPTAAPSPTPAPTPTPTATPAPTPTPEPTPSAEELADEVASIVLDAITEEFGENELTASALDLGVEDADGAYWAVVTNGPQPFYVNDDGDPINFFHIVAVHRLGDDGTWSEEIGRIEIDTAPQRTEQVELVTIDAVPGSAWIVIRGPTGAHAGTFDVIRFDGARLSTALSHISSRPNAGEITDLDGDGLPEFVLNDSNPYVFCYACAVEEHALQIYRWDGSDMSPVQLAVPSGLSPDATTDAAFVVALAEAHLWREAAARAVHAAGEVPGHDGLRWLSILVNQVAAARLGHAGSPGQPLLTHVLAGEYAAALDLKRGHPPAQAFALNGPLIIDTAAEHDLTTMAVTLLDYSERALEQRPDDAAIHAVRALAFALASPDQLDRAREAASRAIELSPDDDYLHELAAFLESAERAPGVHPEAPSADELLPAPSPERLAGGNTIGAGDRGRAVRALQQRLARVPGLGFLNPGRYYDVYNTATREAVIRIQLRADLEPTGVVDRATWDAVEAAWQQPEPVEEPPDRADPAHPPAHNRAGAPLAYLTFDDGPHPTWTPAVLDVLERYRVTATFFVLGQNVARYPTIIERMVEGGHEAENHTFDHIWLSKADREDIVAQVTSTDDALHAVAGTSVDPIECLRPPYAATNERAVRTAAELGKSIVLWSVDPQDWRRPGAEQIASHILANVRPGAIILMHDGGGERSQTVAALETVIEGLTGRGYAFEVICR